MTGAGISTWLKSGQSALPWTFMTACWAGKELSFLWTAVRWCLPPCHLQMHLVVWNEGWAGFLTLCRTHLWVFYPVLSVEPMLIITKYLVASLPEAAPPLPILAPPASLHLSPPAFPASSLGQAFSSPPLEHSEALLCWGNWDRHLHCSALVSGSRGTSALFIRQTFSIKGPEVLENFSLHCLLGQSQGLTNLVSLGENDSLLLPREAWLG